MLATAYQKTGRVEDGLTLIGNLLEMVERTGSDSWEPSYIVCGQSFRIFSEV
jgi:hypothetical protein